MCEKPTGRATVCLRCLLFLCCSDVQVNPGPKGNSVSVDSAKDPTDVQTESKSTSDSSAQSNISPSMAEKILCAIQQQTSKLESLENNMNNLRASIDNIKSDIGQVKSKCTEIDGRCLRLEEEHRKVLGSIHMCEDKMQELSYTTKKHVQEAGKLGGRVDEMDREIVRLKDEVDRLEAFSRRDNLRIFGIPEEENENYDTCAKSVCDFLNKVEGPKTWSQDDFVRAHRVGKGREGGPKPMIVKFGKWKDKMSVITDRKYRDKLQEKGIRVANDLTRNQARIVADARREGKVAYFKGGKMIVGPKKPDDRSYAKVAATDASSSRSSQHDSARSQTSTQRDIRPEGDFPSHDSDSARFSPTRAIDVDRDSPLRHSPPRENRDYARSVRQPDIRQYWGGNSERRSPVNSCPNKQLPRRSERNSSTRR